MLLTDASKAVLEKHLPEVALAKIPPIFIRSEMLSFANILDLKSVADMTGMDMAEIAALDTKLPALARIGKGRIFYSAVGHMPETCSHPINVRVMENGMDWALNKKNACPS